MANASMNAVYERTKTKLALAKTKLDQLPSTFSAKATLVSNYSALVAEHTALMSMVTEAVSALMLAQANVLSDPLASIKIATGMKVVSDLNNRCLTLEAKVTDLNATLDAALMQSVPPAPQPAPGILSSIPKWMLYAGGAVVALGAGWALLRKRNRK